EMPVWKIAMEIAEKIFNISASLPGKEDSGLTSQPRRAAVSISANIAEGYGRIGKADKSKFYDYARGSAYETKSLKKSFTHSTKSN
ncbi:MAG TPA: four helix bundle protein, partial [Cyclobacteriaceae bacterium]|nr:four helix bundle protein [Cyclobacteriaceae bacterium]